MNIVLFESREWAAPLPVADHRAAHLLEILKLTPGDRFAAGETGGLVGSLAYARRTATHLEFADPSWTEAPPPLGRVVLLIGTPRPPTARRLLKDLTTLGAAELHFVATDLGDKSYLMSNLWQNNEFRKHLLEGAAQARTTLLPRVEGHQNLFRALKACDEASPAARVRFDEGHPAWDRHPAHEKAPSGGTLWLALGPERGWSATERQTLEARGWEAAGLGPRVLRTETASSLALGIAHLRGWIP